MTELQQPAGEINGGRAPAVPSNEKVGTKRQRRPSVRLGDIGGDQSYDSSVNLRRSNKLPWKQQLPYSIKDNKSSSSSKTRALMNLSGSEFHETLDVEEKEGNLDSVAIGSWKVRDSKSKRRSSAGTKRIRSNWSSKMDDGNGDGDDFEKLSGGEDDDDDEDNEFRDFHSDSPAKENSPINSLDSLGIENEREGGHYRRTTGRASGGVELDGPSDNWNDNNCNGDRSGVRDWLNQLGLGRYAPVFEIHEVDDEVLPMLTLEDLKDMGINAVGSRRKMYTSIQKLGKSFS